MTNLPSDIAALHLPDLSAAVRNRKVSCLEAMNAFLARIERFNPRVNAIISRRDPDECRAEARAADDALASGNWHGLFHGLPQAPKDLADAVGFPTTMGFSPLRAFMPVQDSIIVERVRTAGAILIGKTNGPEFGLGSHSYNSVFGVTRNAFDPARAAGGSSGGAAVALALDMLPGADGSDMMGSLRNPAGWNKVFGLRPTFGLVPAGPNKDLFFGQLGKEGPMGRSVRELAALLSVQAGWDSRVPLSLASDPATFAAPLDSDVRGLRIGWLGDLRGHLAMDEGVLDTTKDALRTFTALGCHVEDARIDFDMDVLWNCWLTLRSFLVSGNLRAFYDNPDHRAVMKPEAIWEVEQGLTLAAHHVYTASQTRSAWYRALHAAFETFDFLVLPTAQTAPFLAEQAWPETVGGRRMDTYHRWMEVVIGPTLAGVPALSVPAGFTPDGLPLGIQIIGPARSDLEVLRLGHAYEMAAPDRDRRSPLLDELR